MARPVSMAETRTAIADAYAVVRQAFSAGEVPENILGIAFHSALREFLDNEYARDLDSGLLPPVMGG